MQQRILILNGSHTEVPLIESAKHHGFYTIVTGNDKDAPGNKIADKYIQADYSDYKRILTISEKEGIQGVVSCSNDFGAITASYVAEKMGLKGHDSFLLTKRLHEKDSFKTIAKDVDLLTVKTIGFSDCEKAKEYVRNASYPIIIKPTDLSGGKGIAKASNYNVAERCIESAFSKSRIKHIVIEPYIEADQHVLFGFIKDRKILFSMSCDDHYLYNPYLASHNSSPARNEEPAKSIIIKEINRLSERLGLCDGFIEVQYMTERKTDAVFIVELMRRMPGNIAFSALDSASSFSWTDWYLLSQIGDNCDAFYSGDLCSGCSSMISIMGSKNGMVNNIFISEKLRSFIAYSVFNEFKGHMIEDYLTERMGYLLCKFPDEITMHSIIDNINDHVQVLYN